MLALGVDYHIRHGGKHGRLAAAVDILFGADGHIHQLPDHDIQHRQCKAQNQADHGILGITGGTGAGRQHRGVDHLGGRSLNDAGDPLGQRIGNGIGSHLSLHRILTGHDHPKNLSGIHSLRSDHGRQLSICTVHAGVVNDVRQGVSGIEDDDVGIAQALGGGNIRRGDAQGSLTQRD